MLQRLHRSLSSKLLAAGLVLSLGLILGIGAVLLISRDRQTTGAALSNADNRAHVVRAALQQITAFQASAAADRLAGQPALRGLLTAGPSQDSALRALLTGSSSLIQLPRTYIVVAGDDGRLVDTTMPAADPQPDSSLGSLRAAEGGHRAAGIELIGNRLPSYDVAVPVTAGDGHVVGAVAYLAPVTLQLQQLTGLIQYPTAFIPADHPELLMRTASGAIGSTPDELRSAIAAGADTARATYAATSGEQVAGSFAAIAAPGSARPAGYVGVEIPASVFAGSARSDEITVGLIALLACIVTTLTVTRFVDRFVRRPLNVVERGVTRIAAGDYASEVPVTSEDELGRLATGVNRMREAIRQSIDEIEASRRRLDRSVELLGGVSRALTTTASGVETLERAVVAAAAAIAGPKSAAILCARENDRLVTRATHGISGDPSIRDWGVVEQLLAGSGVLVESAPPGWKAGGLLAVPMFLEGAVVGALGVITAPQALPKHDEQALAVLANNAAIAIPNARLFQLKSDFLATVQHELRTPLTAIRATFDLVQLHWDSWEEEHKRAVLVEAQASVQQLYAMLETMIDVSLLLAGEVHVHLRDVPVWPAVEEALEVVTAVRRGVLPVQITVDVDKSTHAVADPDRLRQVVQALLDNAVKFTPVGGKVRVTAASANGAMRIQVRDTGCGIPGDCMPRIWEPFYQVDNTSTRAQDGSGMGLTLARRLVELQGGRIEVESTVGHGSRFTVVLPSTAAELDGSRVEKGVPVAVT